MKNYELHPKQQAVYERVVALLKDESWFSGVCMDGFPSEKDIVNLDEEAGRVAVCTILCFDK